MGFDLKEPHVKKMNGEEVLVRNIYCIGRSYVGQAQELNHSVPDEPFFFQKSLLTKKQPYYDNIKGLLKFFLL